MKFSGKKFIEYLVLALLIALTGCASPDRIVLLPNADGSPSAVIVKTATEERVIDKPYEAVSVSQSGGISQDKETPDSVRTRFGSALDAQPQRAVTYVLYYLSGKVEMTPESRAIVSKLKADLKTRSAPEIIVIGHADSVGSDEYNDKLSLDRAKDVQDILIATGIPENLITISGRGKRDPIIRTADGVSEPKNRRVEISIR
jgi:outer membrane protein OmpA-like peptidoglycan-associated protein